MYAKVEVLACPRTQVCKAKKRTVAVLMDLRGSEIRTSYLRDRARGERIKSIKLTQASG